MTFNFNPVGGLTDSSAFPTNPETEAAARQQVQTPLNQIRDYMNGLKLDNIPSCRVYNSTNVSIPNNSSTKVPFNSERFDTDSIHDNASNNTRLTCKTAGVYQITANILWAVAANGRRSISVKLNNTTQIAGQESSPQPDAVNYMVQSLTTLWPLNANDYVELEVYQSSGAALDIVSSGLAYSIEFMMAKVG